jgi:hypothetical protein
MHWALSLQVRRCAFSVHLRSRPDLLVRALSFPPIPPAAHQHRSASVPAFLPVGARSITTSTPAKAAAAAAPALAPAASSSTTHQQHTILGTDEQVLIDPTPHSMPADFSSESYPKFNILKYTFRLQSYDRDALNGSHPPPLSLSPSPLTRASAARVLSDASTKLRVFLKYILHDVEVSNPASLPRHIFKFTVPPSPLPCVCCAFQC